MTPPLSLHTARSPARMVGEALVFFAVVGLGTTAAPAQTQDATMFRLAQSYEQAGNLESAVKLYEELQVRDPSNYVYFDSLRRLYLQLKRYDEAIVLTQRRLDSIPADLPTRSILASTYYKAGREEEAYAEWEKALASDPANPNVYRLVAQSMIENRLLERTAEIYRRARVACGDRNLFTIDLAQLFAATMDYAGASREFLAWLRQNPTQLPYVQSRMAAYTGKAEGRNAAIEAVKEQLRRDDDPKLTELLCWLYMEGKNYDDAFEATRGLDRQTNSQGAQIHAFGDRVFKERAFDVAARAYLEAIRTPVSAARMPSARYGYASALKELSGEADTVPGILSGSQVPVTEAQPRYAGAIASFRQIIDEYPRTEFSAKSYYQIGLIQWQRFFDVDGALSSFESVRAELPAQHILHYTVALKRGEVLTAKGDTARAAQQYALVIGAPGATPDQHDEASFWLAELEYFAGRVQDAIHRLSMITLNLKADYANDALLLLAFLQENALTGEAALRAFARADLLARQRKNTEAIPLFLAVIEKYPRALLIDDALMKVAALQAQARLYADAVASYERLLSQFGESSIALDKARFNIGDLYQFGLGDSGKALAAYEKLLAQFPLSLLSTEARRRIRQLRGDHL